MKILDFNPKKNYAVLRVTNKLDLVFLKKIIEKGDLLTSKTLRNIFLQREEKKEKIKKKSVTLTIRVEKVEFSRMQKLRVKGKIISGPKEVSLGSYHTIEIVPGSKFKLEKEKWEEEKIKNLERAKTGFIFGKPELVQEFFVGIKREDNLVVYGMEQVKLAAEIGAVKIALIPEEKITEKSIENLIKMIEEKGGKIALISGKTKIERKFLNSYKFGAILRFRIR